MTDLTRLQAFKTKAEAGAALQFWKGKGYHVAVAGPTDAVELYNGNDPTAIWQSGASADWYLVLASKAPIEVAAKAAP